MALNKRGPTQPQNSESKRQKKDNDEWENTDMNQAFLMCIGYLELCCLENILSVSKALHKMVKSPYVYEIIVAKTKEKIYASSHRLSHIVYELCESNVITQKDYGNFLDSLDKVAKVPSFRPYKFAHYHEPTALLVSHFLTVEKPTKIEMEQRHPWNIETFGFMNWNDRKQVFFAMAEKWHYSFSKVILHLAVAGEELSILKRLASIHEPHNFWPVIDVQPHRNCLGEAIRVERLKYVLNTPSVIRHLVSAAIHGRYVVVVRYVLYNASLSVLDAAHVGSLLKQRKAVRDLACEPLQRKLFNKLQLLGKFMNPLSIRTLFENQEFLDDLMLSSFLTKAETYDYDFNTYDHMTVSFASRLFKVVKDQALLDIFIDNTYSYWTKKDKLAFISKTYTKEIPTCFQEIWSSSQRTVALQNEK